MAWPVQDDGWTQSAHYALVRALADGTPRIDEYVSETGDISYWQGHYYSVKGPGLAAAALPLYFPLERTGLWPADRRVQLWLLTLWTTTLAAVGLLLLVRRVGESFDPGTGTVAAVALGAATMMLPFATLLFSHVTAALLAFASFAVLIGARASPLRVRTVAGAGALAGVAVCFEYQTALAGLVLAAFATAAQRQLARAAAFGGGFVVALAPLALYNAWAFGSPLHLSYADAVVERGSSGHDVVGAHADGIFGITAPSLDVLRDLLLEDRGLLLTTPIVAAAAAGVVLLYRLGRRAEATAIGAISVLYLVYNAGITTTFGGPFGGETPGPRYVLTTLPFLFAPFGLVYRRAPGVVLALGSVSLLTMAVATATRPTIDLGQVGLWWSSLRAADFTHTAAGAVGAPHDGGPFSMLPFFAALAVAVVACAAAALPATRPTRAHAVTAMVTFAIWLLLVRVVTELRDGGGLVGPLAATALAVTLVVVTARLAPRLTRAGPPTG